MQIFKDGSKTLFKRAKLNKKKKNLGSGIKLIG